MLPINSRDHFNKLSAREQERLSLLVEEMSECIQVCMKIQRHGYESRNPIGETTNSPTSRMLLEQELGDVVFAMHFMAHGADVDHERVVDRARFKAKNIRRWLHHHKEHDVASVLERIDS